MDVDWVSVAEQLVLQLPLLLIRFWILGMYHPCIKMMGAVRQMGVKVQGFCQPVIPSHPSHRSDGYRQGTSPARQKLASEVSQSSPANAKLSALLHCSIRTQPSASVPNPLPACSDACEFDPHLSEGNPGRESKALHQENSSLGAVGGQPKKLVSSCFEPCLYPISRLWMAETHRTPPEFADLVSWFRNDSSTKPKLLKSLAVAISTTSKPGAASWSFNPNVNGLV